MQKDVKSDPKMIQDVSIATDGLLESLGALAVEVRAPENISHPAFRDWTEHQSEVFNSHPQLPKCPYPVLDRWIRLVRKNWLKTSLKYWLKHVLL